MRKTWQRISPKIRRLLIVLFGICVGQAVLYGPSLLGKKILLPLDILAEPNVYLPMTPEVKKIVPQDHFWVDLVLSAEPGRRYVGSEIRAGRFPLWNSYQYAGVPITWPKFSPFFLLSALVESPKVLPWIQVLVAFVGGVGFYVFCRRVLQITFWPATVASWCYPMTGFFVLWQGYSLVFAVVWLPWLLLAVHKTVSEGGGLAVIGLAVVTSLVLISGQLDVVAQVLLVSGLYAIGCYLHMHYKQLFTCRAVRTGIVLTTGFGLGLLLAAPSFLPILEYSQTGSRMAKRNAGEEERPPIGLAALPQVVLPNMYGSTQYGSLPIIIKGQRNFQESSATTYVGVLVTLVLAPLGWCSRRHRAMNVFWAFLALFALSWCLNIPGFVQLLRLPGLNMMSHNRLVFAASFAILAMATVGLEVLMQGQLERRWWFWVPATLLMGLAIWCFYRAHLLPEPIATQIGTTIDHGMPNWWIQNSQDVQMVQTWYVRAFIMAGVLCSLGLAGWLALWLRKTWPTWTIPALGIFLVGDLLWFAHGRSAQCDPALYYPRIPVLEQIAKSNPARIVGYGCLPATLAQIYLLRDIRGYDGVDPARLMSLMALASDPNSETYDYTQTQWFVPRMSVSQFGDVKLSPILDMFGVRYVILRGEPLTNMPPAFQGDDYWALVNNAALPRVFVPRRVETVMDDRERLRKLGSPQFNPRDVAYVETSVGLPAECRGSAEIIEEIPTRIKVSLKMETPGLVVLADLWDKGWHAYLNGQHVPILRANHAIRGVVVPAGTATLEFRYQPASFILGLWLSGLAVAVLSGCLIASTRRTARFTLSPICQP